MADHPLELVRLGIDSHQEPIVYMRADCHVCRSEGFVAHSRVHVATASSALVATLNVVHGDLLRPGEAGLSESAWMRLGARAAELARFSHAPPVESLGALRAKIYGKALNAAQIQQILRDVAAGRYADIEIAALLTAFSAAGMSIDEILGLTRGMVEVGDRLHWSRSVVADKHCVGGLPGNRTTPIVASLGVCIPKTSSRAITSPAGTADTMETLTRVDLDLAAMRRVVEREGGCVVWGGAVGLSPVDDLLIRIERALDIDSEAQLVASVLSKKIAAGSTHVVIDIPVGPTAKVRTQESASLLSGLLSEVGQRLGLQIRTVVTDGTQPVGRGIGPALEARELLAVIRSAPDAAVDLKARATRLAAEVLELAGHCPAGQGEAAASAALVDGRAWRKLEAICEAQGGLLEPPSAQHRWEATAAATGRIASLDNRRLSRVAKLAGAPSAKAAGILLRVRVGDLVERGKPLFELHAETSGELEYARSYLAANPDIIRTQPVG